jgi:hypothetical protein
MFSSFAQMIGCYLRAAQILWENIRVSKISTTELKT